MPLLTNRMSILEGIVVGAVVTILLIGVGIYTQSKSNSVHNAKTMKSPANNPKKQSGSSTTKTASNSVREDGEDGSILKGYKKTSDGKTTSYFHREVSDKDLQLIGDCTPKRIDTSSPSPMPVSPSPTSGSVWNAAGTHEEKNFSPWAHQHLKELISCTTFSLPSHVSSSGVLMVTRVVDVSGDASIITTRGKKKYIYDFTAQIEYQLMGTTDSLSGAMTVSDISADSEAEFTTSAPTVMSGPSARKIYDEFVRKSDCGLQLALQTAFEILQKDVLKTF